MLTGRQRQTAVRHLVINRYAGQLMLAKDGLRRDTRDHMKFSPTTNNHHMERHCITDGIIIIETTNSLSIDKAIEVFRTCALACGVQIPKLVVVGQPTRCSTTTGQSTEYLFVYTEQMAMASLYDGNYTLEIFPSERACQEWRTMQAKLKGEAV